MDNGVLLLYLVKVGVVVVDDAAGSRDDADTDNWEDILAVVRTEEVGVDGDTKVGAVIVIAMAPPEKLPSWQEAAAAAAAAAAVDLVAAVVEVAERGFGMPLDRQVVLAAVAVAWKGGHLAYSWIAP